jgi:hypothetical protein
MENLENQEIPLEFQFRGIDNLILPSFLKLLDNKDVIIDFSDETNLSVSYSKKALKWLKDVKKKDPFWKEDDFIVRVLYSATKMISQEEESQKLIEDQKIEENDVHNTDETTNTTISN